MNYIDVCSGISAPTMAWKPLGWRALCFSEIAAAPRAVLKHRYPEIPLHGRERHKSETEEDYANAIGFQTIEGREYGSADVIVGGTPCQGFSIAGLRGGMDDERSILSLEFSRLAYRSGSRWMVWENVPGAFSSNAGRDFGAILGEFSGRHGYVFEPPADGWRNSGIVEPADERSFGLAWRVLDLRHFGVPQRRRRIFVVGYIGDWRPPAAVLFERHSMSGDSPPRKGPRQGDSSRPEAAPRDDRIPEVANCLTHRTDKGVNSKLDEGQTLVPLTAHSLRGEGHDAMPRLDGSETLIPLAFSAKDRLEEVCEDFSPPLRAGSHSDSHANGGVMPAVAYAIQERAISENPENGPDGVGIRDDGEAFTIEARPNPQAVAYVTESPTLSARTKGGGGLGTDFDLDGGLIGVAGIDLAQITHPANRSKPSEEEQPTLAGTGQPAVAFTVSEQSNGFAWESEDHPTLSTVNGGNQLTGVRTEMAVRKLTPRECERLMAFPDDFTLVPYRGGMMKDGPRYKMIGNSQGVPKIRWIGERIEMVEKLLKERAS